MKLTTYPELRTRWSPKNPQAFDYADIPTKSKAWWICEKGHEWEAQFSNVTHNGVGCPYCTGKRATFENSIAAIPHLAKEWGDNGALQPQDVTRGSGRLINWICSKGHEFKSRPLSRTIEGCGCPYCAGKKANQENSLAALRPDLAKFLSPRNPWTADQLTLGSGKEAVWVCAQGHEITCGVSEFVQKRSKHFCAQCNLTTKSLAAKFPHLKAQWDYSRNDYIPDTVLPSSNLRAHWICSKGHQWDAFIYSRTREDIGCPSCGPTHTKLEKAGEELLGLGKYNKCPFPKGKQPYIKHRPDMRASDTLFINVDGLYHHSVEKVAANYHRNMRRLFESHGFRIMQFYEDEIHGKPQIVKSMVQAVLGKLQVKLFARKMTVEVIKNDEANKFLEQNHIIGRSFGAYHLGLRNQDSVLVQVMSWRQNEDSLEIVRSAGLLNTVVVGGFQRLLKALREKAPHLPVKTLVDLRYADGHSLVKAGFVPGKERTQYQYTDGYVRIDKRQFRVKAGIDEVAVAKERGYVRIFDAGKRSYMLP